MNDIIKLLIRIIILYNLHNNSVSNVDIKLSIWQNIFLCFILPILTELHNLIYIICNKPAMMQVHNFTLQWISSNFLVLPFTE
jgi:hypothetical protein